MTDYTDSFEATWKIYPKRNGHKRGKSTSFSEWEKLTIDDQRAAYRDIKDRNLSGGWEYVRDMERYLKRREWEDEWQGQKVFDNPDLLTLANRVGVDELCDYALSHRKLCEHQLRSAWNYFGPQPGVWSGVQIPACDDCGHGSQRVTSSEVPS